MTNKNGIIVYEGNSLIDGNPIVVVVTGFNKTNNPKTGQMLQSFIVRSDMSAHDARSCGADFSVCGDCKHRVWGTCYVNVHQSPNNVSRAYMAGSYEKLSIHNIHRFIEKNIRIGSYGDPASVPYEIWENLLKYCKYATGYSHLWRNCDQRYKNILMASVDTLKEMFNAHTMGWRTFRVCLPSDVPTKKEFICPASNEGGKKIQCTDCLLCGGKKNKAKNPVIVAHGGGVQNYKAKRFIKIMKKIRQKKKYTHLIKG